MTDLDAHALDESKLLDLIRDLDTGHIQDIDRTATSNAISSLWDMVVELRSDLARAEEASQSHYLQAMENGGHLNALRAQVAEARAKVALLDNAISYTSEQALASEIPVGYGPEDKGAWTQGYDAAIRHARRARNRALIAQAKGDDA